MNGAPARLPATLQLIERGWLSSNSIVCDDADGATVVDTGYVSHAPMTVQLIEQALRGRPLRRIVNTHLHSDHVGGNAALRQRFGSAIVIPPGDAPAVRAWDEEALLFAATGQRCARFDYDALIDTSRTLRLGGLDWQVLEGGGHYPQMVLLYCDEARLLISADALWADGFGVLFPELEGESGFAEQQAVLDRVAMLQPSVIIPGHGAAFTEVGRALETAYRRLDALRAEPERNARHAAKVLIKFWLLEVRSASLAQLHQHFAQTRYMQLIQRRYFARQPIEKLVEDSVAQLVKAGAAELAGTVLHNRDR